MLLLFAAIISAAAFAPAKTDDTVSMVCTTVEDTPRHFGLMLVPDTKTWQEFEPGNAQNFFKTKKGVYVALGPANTVYLCNTMTVGDCIKNANSQAGNLTGMIPHNKGDKGQGKAEETGIAFSWEVK